MMAGALSNLLQVILPSKKAKPAGTAYTNTFNPTNTTSALARPSGLDHISDLLTDRQVQDSRTLLKSLFRNDPDVSGTVHAYLTVADTDPWYIVRDLEGNIDREAHKMVDQILRSITERYDYTQPQPFSFKQGLRAICDDLRYMCLLRGGIAAELVTDKTLRPSEIRVVDLNTIEWTEKTPGVYLPVQTTPNSSDKISLNIPTFFISFYRRDPTNIYSDSPFVSSINTIAARQQVINDLYRIMQKTGYPRLSVKVIEEVLRKNAPASAREDENLMKEWLGARLSEIGTAFANIRPDQAAVHMDSVEPAIINQGGPGQSMNVSSVIDVLNAQNQAALKVMATIIGRGEMGVNTASVEARIFSMSAESLNRPLADLFSQMLTLALRLMGNESTVTFGFEKVELRPETELEPQLLIKQGRLLTMLSHGLISDDEFHIEMFSRIRPDFAPELSGTGFYEQSNPAQQTDVSPNSDPLGRSVTPPNTKSAKSKTVK